MNARLDTIQAAILLAKFNYFETTIKTRNYCANYYLEKLKELHQLILPKVDNNNISAWAQFSILAESKEVRDKIVDYMKKNNVNLSIFYPSPLHHQKCFENISRNHSLSVTEIVCSRVFNLPCYGELTIEEMDIIIDLLYNYYK
jgi:dTDP-4-amino-4,6-dideoxygalactose transaminase